MFARSALFFFALATFSNALYFPRSPAINALDARNPEPRSGLSERDNYPIIDARDFDELDSRDLTDALLEARGEAAKPVVSHGVPQTHTATKRMPEPTQRDIHEARGEAAKPVVSHGVPQTHTATKRMPEPTQRDIHEARGEAAKPVVSNGVPQTHTATKRMPEPTQRDIHGARGEAAKPVVSHGVPQTHTATKRMPEPTSVVKISNKVLSKLKKLVDSTIHSLTASGKSSSIDQFKSQIDNLKTQVENGSVPVKDLLRSAKTIAKSF